MVSPAHKGLSRTREILLFIYGCSKYWFTTIVVIPHKGRLLQLKNLFFACVQILVYYDGFHFPDEEPTTTVEIYILSVTGFIISIKRIIMSL